MQAHPTLSPEQERTLCSVHDCLTVLVLYLEAFAPYVTEADEFHVKSLIGFGSLCDRRLVEHFECVRAWDARKKGQST